LKPTFQNVLEIKFLIFCLKTPKKNVSQSFFNSFLGVLSQFYSVGMTKVETPADPGVLLQFQCCIEFSICFGSMKWRKSHDFTTARRKCNEKVKRFDP